MEHRGNRPMVPFPGADRRHVPVDLPHVSVLGVCAGDQLGPSMCPSVHVFEHSVPTSGAGTVWGQSGTFWTWDLASRQGCGDRARRFLATRFQPSFLLPVRDHVCNM